MPPKKKGKKKGKGKKKNAEAAKKAAEEKDLLLESFKQMNLTGVGRCLLKGCNCKYFIAGFYQERGCYGCSHSSLYHAKTREEQKIEDALKALTRPTTAASAFSSVLNSPGRPGTAPVGFKHLPEPVQEMEPVDEEPEKPAKPNKNGCSVKVGHGKDRTKCPCTGFVGKAFIIPPEHLIDPKKGASIIPVPCKQCQHADFYHLPDEEGDGKKGGGKAPAIKKR